MGEGRTEGGRRREGEGGSKLEGRVERRNDVEGKGRVRNEGGRVERTSGVCDREVIIYVP